MSSARERSRTPVPLMVKQTRGQHLLGTVKNFNGTWGFLQSPEITGDIFYHIRDSPQFTGPALVAGEAVKFHVVQSSESERNNGMHALNVQRQVAIGTQEAEWVTGTLTKLRGSMAFCSVRGIEGDVLLGKRSLDDSGVDLRALQVGACLTFKMVWGSKGYHATNIQQPSQHWQGSQPSQHWQGSQRVHGTLKKIHGDNGFCSVAGVADDVLLGSRSLAEAGINLTMMQLGDSLTFEVVNGPKGYHAINVQQTVKALGPKGYSKGFHAPNIQQPFQHGQARQRVVGTLKKIHGGNGFCSVVGVADDVLLGSRSLNDCGVNLETMQLGDNLIFEIVMGPKGYQAINIQQSHAGKRVVGTLKKIHGGNGFCSVEGVADDILLGARSLSDSGVNLETMQLGEALSFEMACGPKGYHATNIHKETESA